MERAQTEALDQCSNLTHRFQSSLSLKLFPLESGYGYGPPRHCHIKSGHWCEASADPQGSVVSSSSFHSDKIVLQNVCLSVFCFSIICSMYLVWTLGLNFYFLPVFSPLNKHSIKERILNGFSVIINKSRISTCGWRGISMRLTLISTWLPITHPCQR